MSQGESVALPSERSFGLLMAGVAGAATLFFAWRGQGWQAGTTAVLCVGLLVLALLAPAALAWPNRLWFRLGMLLNKIVSPIVLGAIFFVIITPVGLVRRMLKADALRLSPGRHLETYWIARETKAVSPDSFKNQF